MRESKGKAIPLDIFDKEGNLTCIEFTDSKGKHILDATWDESDAQTNENRAYFRNWACQFLENQGWEIEK
jgi:hypothetical protein